MSGWFVLLFARSYLNSSAHKLPASTEHVFTGWLVLCLFVFGLLFGLVLVLGLLVLFFDCTPEWTLDCVMVRAPFSLPNAGY